MSDMDGGDLAKLGVSGAGLLAGLWAAIKFLGGRQVGQLDQTIKKLGESSDHLAGEIQKLREANVKFAGELGALQGGLVANRERIDETARFWRESLKDATERIALLERSPKGKGRGG